MTVVFCRKPLNLLMTSFTAHVIYLRIFLDSGRVFLLHSPLRLGDRLSCTHKSPLRTRLVLKLSDPPFWSVRSRVSNFNPLIQGFF